MRLIATRLRNDGLRVWFDDWEIRPGDNIPAKVEEGLERSRVLVLCMSASAFGSEWAVLETGTFRFRDPLNKARRFIPLRLDDSEIRGSLAQFRFIDWHDSPDEAYPALLEACAPAPAAQDTTGQYQQPVDIVHPALVQLILDDSASMEGLLSNGDPRYLWLEHLACSILTELLARSTSLRGGLPVVRPLYYLDVIRYGSTAETWSTSELDIGQAAALFDASNGSFGLGGKLGGTDHRQAFALAYERMRSMVQKKLFRNSFPPVVLHVTDGESQTDPGPEAQQLTSLFTSDGNVLLINAYIGTVTRLTYRGNEDFVGFVTASDVGPNEDNLRLFRMSSVIPENIRISLLADGILPQLRPSARLFFTGELLSTAIRVVTCSAVQTE